MSHLSNRDVQLAQSMFVSSATQQHKLGTRGVMDDGRIFRYVKAGGVDTIAGRFYQSAATIPGSEALAVNTTSQVAVGGSALAVTCGSSVAANFYAEGYAVIASSAGQGYMYQLDNHAAVSTGATGQFAFYNPNDANTIQVALTTTSIVTLVANKYNNIVIVPVNTATGLVVGVSTYIITTLQFGWIQTWGLCAVQSNGTEAIGQMMNGIAASCGRAFQLTSPAVTGCAIIGQYVGHAYQTGVAGQWVCYDLRISP